jgi:2-polyprenyl-6-hydroxyphenyl methylase/3-demethylubiquinone-9 3-methyltransferase
MLGVESLAGRRFLDVGSGSGLFSLAARRLGANRVHSVDVDPASVACARELRARWSPEGDAWSIEEGSILDERLVAGLGRWDVVYSWGALHHTGSMWRALELAQSLVADGGVLFVSIYNDQGARSKAWRLVKRAFNKLPAALRPLLTVLVMGPYELVRFGGALVTARPSRYVRSWTDYKSSRGMSRWHDLVDWVGGYPFEVARPEEVLAFLEARGFRSQRLVICGGKSGCNEYVLRRVA